MLDDNKLSEYLKNSTAFCMKLKKSKKELQKFLEYHPESSILMEIRRDARQNNGVKLLKIVLRKFGGDSLYWKYFNETFEAYGVCVCVRVCVCVCVCVCVFMSIHRAGFICMDQLHYQGADQRCCVEGVIFLCQVPSSLL